MNKTAKSRKRAKKCEIKTKYLNSSMCESHKKNYWISYRIPALVITCYPCIYVGRVEFVDLIILCAFDNNRLYIYTRNHVEMVQKTTKMYQTRAIL